MYRSQPRTTGRPATQYFLEQWNPATATWEVFPAVVVADHRAPTFGMLFGLDNYSLPTGETGWCSNDPVNIYRAINWLNGGTGQTPGNS